MTVQPLVIDGYEKDTAGRMNGLERPKPNEGYALQNGVFTASVADGREIVKWETPSVICFANATSLRREANGRIWNPPLRYGLAVGERPHYSLLISNS